RGAFMSASDPRQTSAAVSNSPSGRYSPPSDFRVRKMRRRDFIKAVGGISVGWLPPAYAQRTNKTPRVGVLWHAGSAEEETIGLGALTRAFSDLGYVGGK